jgi:hypothetical protein
MGWTEIEENTAALLDASKEVDQEVNVQGT